MNDILKYYPITFVYDGAVMTVPLGEIVNVHSEEPGLPKNAIIQVRDDSWITDSTYTSIIEQWNKALALVVPNPKEILR